MNNRHNNPPRYTNNRYDNPVQFHQIIQEAWRGVKRFVTETNRERKKQYQIEPTN